MNEPFRAGSPDFSPILNRAKALDPDVLFIIGYSGDNLQIARQACSSAAKPKLLVTQGAGEKRSDYGDAGDGVVVVDLWSSRQTTPGLAEWVKKAEEARGGEVVSTAVQGYVSMQNLIDAAKAAGSWDRAAIIDKLSTMTFDTPYGKVGYAALRIWRQAPAHHREEHDRRAVSAGWRAGGRVAAWQGRDEDQVPGALTGGGWSSPGATTARPRRSTASALRLRGGRRLRGGFLLFAQGFELLRLGAKLAAAFVILGPRLGEATLVIFPPLVRRGPST